MDSRDAKDRGIYHPLAWQFLIVHRYLLVCADDRLAIFKSISLRVPSATAKSRSLLSQDNDGTEIAEVRYVTSPHSCSRGIEYIIYISEGGMYFLRT